MPEGKKITIEDYEKIDQSWKKIHLLRREIEETKKEWQFPVDSKLWFNKDVNEKLKVKAWAPPLDARFPQANQTRHCWLYYIDYFRCKNFKGENYEPCEYFKAVYLCTCPTSWIERFDNWRAENRFPADFTK